MIDTADIVVPEQTSEDFFGGWSIKRLDNSESQPKSIVHRRLGTTLLAHTSCGLVEKKRITSPANCFSFMLVENYKQRGQWDYDHLPACTLFCLPPKHNFDFQIGRNAKLYGFSFDVDGWVGSLAAKVCEGLAEGRARIVEIESQMMSLLITLYQRATPSTAWTAQELEAWQHSVISSLSLAVNHGRCLPWPNLLKEFEAQPLMQRLLYSA
ncbi:hypothetical protein [Sinobacterium caligoides]|uniref:hypothetical protein n=1 Tax=Sinobacterium caligoides TaxID=933926 RepID=UPI0011CE46BC|nr:hypothetical protein [Sinobacterium caligoides]